MTLCGCNTDGCDVSGLKEIAGKEPTGVDFPGEELGSVSGFHPRYALGRNGSLEAIAGYDDQGAVLIVPADRADPCAVPVRTEGAELEGVLEDMLAVLSSTGDGESGSLSLYDPNCKKIGADHADARLIPRSERLVPLRMLLLENTDELVAVDPNDRRDELIDRDVSMVEVLSERVLVLAGGRLVVRNMALEELDRIGSGVTEAALGRDGRGVAYVDGGRVTYLSTVEGDPRVVDDNACGLGFADQEPRSDDGAPRFLSYYSPCEESRLVVYDLERDQRVEVGTAPDSHAAVRELGAGGKRVVAVFYLTQVADGSGAPSVLGVATEGEAPAILGTGELRNVGRASIEGVPVWLDSDSEGSRVARVTVNADIRVDTLVDGVEGFGVRSYPERALVSREDGRKALVAIEGESEPAELAEDSPSLGGGNQDLSFFGSDADGDVGTLQLLEQGEAPLEIARDVAISTVSLGFSAESLFYLRGYDAESGIGELCMQIVRNGDTFCEPDVLEYRTSIRPKRAVVYVKKVGKDSRLFWARVQ